MRRKLNLWSDSKYCPNCKQELHLNHFNKNKHKALGVESRCRRCESDRKKAAYLEKKEKRIAEVENILESMAPKLQIHIEDRKKEFYKSLQDDLI